MTTDAGVYLTDGAVQVAPKKSKSGGLCSVTRLHAGSGSAAPLGGLATIFLLGLRRRIRRRPQTY